MRVLIGISGGLDSAYSIKLLQDAGYTVEGATLLMHDYTSTLECERVAKEFSIPLHIIDCRERFGECVKKNFVNEYISGRTPNPCVICNSEIKFKFLYEYAMEHGFDRISTGHYARIKERGGVYSLHFAKDSKKDQTYMLWRLPQEILSKLILPLGELEKSEVRRFAKDMGLSVAEKEESQEICFIPDGDYASYIEKMSGKSPCGDFIDTNGNVLGRHNGIVRYTVGQRKGLGIALGKRMFITKINPSDNTITLSDCDEGREELCVNGILFSSDTPMEVGESREYDVKLRYLQPPVRCALTYLGDGVGRVKLSSPVRAVTPGQSAVFYSQDRLALGSFISSIN